MIGLLSLVLIAAQTPAAKTVTVTGGAKDATHVVVHMPAPAGIDALSILQAPGVSVPAIIVDGTLTFVVPSLKAGQALTLTSTSIENKRLKSFGFFDSPEGYTDLTYGRPVTRFVTKKHDGSTPATHMMTFKPFHHVFDPAGTEIITSGAYPFAQAKDKSVLYPHHRGIYFGWKASYNNKIADTWHGRDGVYSEVEKELAREANPVFARQKVLIRWVGPDGLQFAEEERQVTAYAVDNATMLDFESKVTTKLPNVKLDGDPQHAGLHFRAAQDVVKNAKNTVYTRPDGQDKPGATRNYPTQKTHVNLPWDAMSYTIGDQQYTTVMVDRPENPKEARWSERDYGRFGSYFVAEVTPKKPVEVAYRLFIQRGGVTVPECAAIAAGFVGETKAK